MSAPKFFRPGLAVTLTALMGVGFTLNSVAQSVATTPVGAVTLEALANSDSYFSIPLVRPSVFEGVISSKSGNTLGLTGAAFTANQLQYTTGSQPDTYYVQIASGAASGQFSTILSNTSNTITGEYEQDILGLLQVGDRVVIRPYWTLGTVFPASSAGISFVASTNNLISGRRTEILLPDTSTVGINKSPSATFFYNGYWRRVGGGADNYNDQIITPDTYFVIRGNNYASSTSITVIGGVQTTDHTVSLLRSSLSPNDNPVAVFIPVGRTLSQLNLIGGTTPFALSTNNLQSGRGDELLVYDNNQVGKNKAQSATYFYNGQWRKVGDVGANQNDTVLPAGSALVIRKKQAVTTAVIDWKQDPVVVGN